MTLAAVQLFPLALFTGLIGLAVLTDLQEYRIPNTVNLAIAALYPVYAAAVGIDPTGPVLLAAAVLAVGTGLFALGLLGGGDVKLIAAVALWIGPDAFPLFLVVMALTGGALALFQGSSLRMGLVLMLDGRGASGFQSLVGRDVPYAVAIAAGIFAAMISGGGIAG